MTTKKQKKKQPTTRRRCRPKAKPLFNMSDGALDVRIISTDTGGNVIFAVPLRRLGLTYEDFRDRPELSLPASANFLGQFCIQRDIETFLPLLAEHKAKYREMCTNHSHRRFGLTVSPEHAQFQFHISLLHVLLNSYFHGVVGDKRQRRKSRTKKLLMTTAKVEKGTRRRLVQFMVPKTSLGKGTEKWRTISSSLEHALKEVGVNMEIRLRDEYDGFRLRLYRMDR